MYIFTLKIIWRFASLLLREKVARFTATDEVLLQYIAETNPISLCSHPDAHPNLNREVRRSLTWHSSESESALERFEPVAVAMLWRDGSLAMFAPVAARRRKVLKEESVPLFVLFVLFGQAKRTLKENFLQVSSTIQSPNFANRQNENQILHPLFLRVSRRKRKSYQKEVPYKLSRSAERDEDSASSTAPPSPKGGRKL